MLRPILRSYLAEINLGTGFTANQSINFFDFPELRNVVIFAIEAIDANILSVSPTQKSVVSTLVGITVTIVNKEQKQIIQAYPCTDLNPFTTGGLYREFHPFPLNLVKSFITINAITGLNANESVVFNVFYATKEDLDKYNTQNKKAAVQKKVIRKR